MAFTPFATSEPFDSASGARMNQFGNELQQQINVLNAQVNSLPFTNGANLSYTINNHIANGILSGQFSFMNSPECDLSTSWVCLCKFDKIDKVVYVEVLQEYFLPASVTMFEVGGEIDKTSWKKLVTLEQLNNALAINNLTPIEEG